MSNEFADIESPSVQALVDPTTARIGDLITLSIRVTHPDSLQVDPPAFSKSLGVFEVYASTRLPAEHAGGKSVERFQATLQSFTTGQLSLPGLEVPYRDPMGKVQWLKTPDLTVAIQEVPPGPKDREGELRGLKGVIGPTAWSPWWWLLAAAAIFALCFLLWRKRKRALVGPPPEPPVPAEVAALERLMRLKSVDWLATGKTKDFYSEISDALRAYIEGRYGTPALERTTFELLRDLRNKDVIPNPMQSVFRDLVEACDLVKFAKFRPESGEGQAALEQAIQFVESTRPPEPPKGSR